MYKVGDRVRIINDLEEDNSYGSDDVVVDDMLEYAGAEAKIIRYCGGGLYELSCDDGDYYWPENTLTPYTESNYDKIHSMTDEQLARFLIEFENKFGEEYEGEMSCLDWLRKPDD